MPLENPSKGVEASSASRTRPVITLKSMKADEGAFPYKSHGQDDWIPLPVIGYVKRNDVKPIVFDGSILITQKEKGNRCKVKLEEKDYSLESFTIGTDGIHIVGVLKSLNTPQCSFESDNKGEGGVLKAQTCLLAELCRMFSSIRLMLPPTALMWTIEGGYPIYDTNTLIHYLMELCSGHSAATSKPV